MQLKNDQINYGAVAQVLHWLIAILIFWAIALGKIAEEMPFSPEKVNIFVLHKSAGISVLILVILRLIWRFITPPPSLGLEPKQEKIAHLGHWGLYGLMVAVPLSGWLLNSAAGYPFAWFHLVSVPSLPVGKELKDFFGNVHVVLFYVIAIAVIGHVAMLFHHKFAQGKSFLPRMLPGQKLSSGVVLILILCGLITYAVLASKVEPKAEATPAVSEAKPSAPEALGEIKTSAPLWVKVDGDSQLGFKGKYSGEPFDGEFQQFNPKIYFDPANPEQGIFDVEIDTTSITTHVSDWDLTLRGSEWFAFSDYMQSHFFSDTIRATDDGFVAEGKLTLKGVSRPVSVAFEWQELGDGEASFIGGAEIDRRDFNIGSGGFSEDDSVGFNVGVVIELKLTQDKG